MPKPLLSTLVSAVLACACLTASSCALSGSGATIPGPTKPSTPAGLTVSPSAFSIGPGDQGGVTASESGFSGSFTATSSDQAVAAVTNDGPSHFILTAVAPGLCTVTVSDGNGNTAQVNVSVQITIIGGQ